MRPDYVRKSGDEGWMGVERITALQVSAMTPGNLPGDNIQIIEDFDVVAHKTNGYDQDILFSTLCQTGHHLLNRWPQPCFTALPGALVAKLPAISG